MATSRDGGRDGSARSPAAPGGPCVRGGSRGRRRPRDPPLHRPDGGGTGAPRGRLPDPRAGVLKKRRRSV